MSGTGTYSLGIDMGGTFTDFALLDEGGHIVIAKTISTHGDPEQAMSVGLKLLGNKRGMTLSQLVEQCAYIVLGTTWGTNSLVSRRWPTTGLLTTDGSRDTIEVRQGYREDRYNWRVPAPPMIVPRYLRRPVKERITIDGDVLIPMDEDDILKAIEVFKKEGVLSVAVCFLWSFVNPRHEIRAREILNKEFPGAHVSISSEILPELGEYCRASTTVVNACLMPTVAEFVDRLERSLHSWGFRGKMRYMQCNAGVVSGEVIKQKPVYSVGSGPAAGPVLGLLYGGMLGSNNVITIDMGGTSLDASLMCEGSVQTVKNVDVNDYRLGIPQIDVSSIGAGGGSIARIDAGGMLKVGPQSAEADPGPACYMKGGQEPTVTDANVVLGYFNPNHLLGGALPIDSKLSHDSMSKIAGPLAMSPEAAALAIIKIVNSNMVNAIHQISLQRGYDTREFVLVVAGGCGPAHAGRLAEALEIPTVVVPKIASAFCAVGEVIADIRHDYSRGFPTKLEKTDCGELTRVFAELEDRAYSDLQREGVSTEDITMTRTMDIRYVGQSHECTINVPAGQITPETVVEIEGAFYLKHESLYTFAERDGKCEVINLGLIARGKRPGVQISARLSNGKNAVHAKKGTRLTLFEESAGPVQTPIFDGNKMEGGNVIKGPAIIEEDTTTLVVFPRWKVELDGRGFYVMTPAMDT